MRQHLSGFSFSGGLPVFKFYQRARQIYFFVNLHKAYYFFDAKKRCTVQRLSIYPFKSITYDCGVGFFAQKICVTTKTNSV